MTMDASSAHATARRSRDKKGTLERLKAAMLEVSKGGRRLSIKAVAQVAGVDPSLIHHVYPDLAEQIRAHAGKSVHAQRDDKHQKLILANKTIQAQRAEIVALKADLAKLASINLDLQDRIDEYAAVRLHGDGGE